MASVRIGGARVDITGQSASLEKAMRKASSAFDRQEKELRRLRSRAQSVNRVYATMRNRLNAVATAAVALGTGVLANFAVNAINNTANWGSELYKVGLRLDLMPSQLYAIQNAFEDNNVAVSLTNQFLTALTRRFASNSQAMRRAAQAVGIDLQEWDSTLGNTLELVLLIERAMGGAASQAAKLNFLQEAGSTAGRPLLTGFQRGAVSAGLGIADPSIDRMAQILDEYAQLQTDIAREQKEEIAKAVVQNIDGYTRFSQAVSDFQVGAIKFAAWAGRLLSTWDRWSGGQDNTLRKTMAGTGGLLAGGSTLAIIYKTIQKWLQDTRGDRELRKGAPYDLRKEIDRDLKRMFGREFQKQATQFGKSAGQRLMAAAVNSHWSVKLGFIIAGGIALGLRREFKSYSSPARPHTDFVDMGHVDREPVGQAHPWSLPRMEPEAWAQFVEEQEKITEGGLKAAKMMQKEYLDDMITQWVNYFEKQKELENGMAVYRDQVWSAIAERSMESLRIQDEDLRSTYEAQTEFIRWQQDIRLNMALDVAARERQIAEDSKQAWMNAMQGIVSSTSNALSAWVSGTEKAGDAFRKFVEGVLNSLLQIAQQAAAMKLFNLLFAGGAASNAFLPSGSGRVPIGHGARGGMFPAGRALVTGETGPELQFPAWQTRVVPWQQLAGAGAGGGRITINVNGVQDPMTVRAAVRRALPEIQDTVDAAMKERMLYPNSTRNAIARGARRGTG